MDYRRPSLHRHLQKRDTLLFLATNAIDTNPDFEGENIAVAFNYSMLDTYTEEWYLRKQQLRSGEITKDEYRKWKLNWPYTSDVMRKYVPHREWRKKKNDMKTGVVLLSTNCTNNQ